MAIQSSEAVLLKAFNWSESSRTVHFFSKKSGKLALVDKAGRSIKSKRGRLMPFARIELTFYVSERATSGYISSADLLEVFSFEKDGNLGRLAYGSAACELLFSLLPEEQPQVGLYDYFVSYLRYLDQIDKQFIPALFIAFLLRLLSQLGYHPNLTYCVGCSKTIDEFANQETLAFSPARGGIVSPACQKPGEYYIDLPLADVKILSALQVSSLQEAARLPIGFEHSARLIDAMTKFLSYQSGLKPELKSLEFLDKLKSSKNGNKSQPNG
jgi:DNA repair protein RecO